MRNLTQNEIYYLSFPDAEITNMKISSREKELIVEAEFAHILYSEGGKLLNHGVLRFKNWSKFLAKTGHSNSSFTEMPFGILEPLEEINVIEINKDFAFLGGFSSNHGGKYFGGELKWIDYQIEGAEVSAMFEFEDP